MISPEFFRETNETVLLGALMRDLDINAQED